MKRIIKLNTYLLALLLPITAYAHDFAVNGIYYKINGTEATVTYKGTSYSQYSNEYTGDVSIPSSVSYNGTTYSVTSIDDFAFYYCSGLTSVTIPNSVTEIGYAAFVGCNGLTSVSITDLTAWCKIQFSETLSNPLYYAHHLYLNGSELTDLMIPNTVTSIGNYAFKGCSGLTSITIPKSVTSIGERAFEDCSGLASVCITDLMAWCKIQFSENFSNPLYYAHHLYLNGSELTDLMIPNTVTTIGYGAFEGCSGLTSVTIPNSVISIGYYAFYGCSGLTSVIIGNSVTEIGRHAFQGCSALDTINFNAANCADFIMANYSPFYDLNISTINIGDSVQRIPDYFANGLTNLTSVKIPNSVTSIGREAFYGCSGLTSVSIGNSVISIGGGAFRGCSGLTSLTIPNSVTSIGWDAFYGCSGLTSVIIGNSVTSIGNNAFYGCSGLTSVTIPNSVTSIGTYAFYGCSGLNRVDITDIVAWCSISFNNGDSNPLGHAHHLYLNGVEVTNLTIPNSVTSVGGYAFYGCSGLTSVTIPNSVTSVGGYAFYGCSGLTSVTIPNSVTSIGNSAFVGCSMLETLNYNAVTCADFIYESGYRPFNNLNISTINIGDSVESIPAYFAYGLTKLANVTIGNSVTSIGNSAFYGCSGLTKVTVSNLAKWCQINFRNATTNPLYYAKHLYLNGNEVTDLVVPEDVEAIGDYAFYNCCLTSVRFNQSLASVGKEAFNNSPTIETVTCAATIPPSWNDIAMFTTNVYNHTPLYVPLGKERAYMSDQCWGQFANIIGIKMNDEDNYLSLNDAEAFHGDTIVIPVAMTNAESIISFQTDIFLPEGLELMQEDGEYMIDPSPRMTLTHSIMSNDVSNGAVRVICYSSNYKPFTGNSGDDLFYITVKVADDAEGDYIIQLKNTLLTNTDFVDIVAPDVAANVNVKSYLLGDANNSGTVTVTDVVVTAQYVLERNPQPFVFEAADVNFDNNITVADVSRIAWMVLNPTLNAPLRAPAMWNNGDFMSGDITLATCETSRVNILLDNEMDYSAFQLDLNLPAGLTASNFQLTDRAGSHAFDVNTLQNGNIRALCYSPDMTAINGHEGALLTFDVTATGYVKGDIIVDGIELITTACQSVRLDAFTICVNNPSGFNEVVAGKTVAKVEYFNLAGQQIEQPENGVTLVVTTYTDGTRSTSKVIR